MEPQSDGRDVPRAEVLRSAERLDRRALDFTEVVQRAELFAAKFKNEKLAHQFLTAIESAQLDLQQHTPTSPSSATTSTTSNATTLSTSSSTTTSTGASAVPAGSGVQQKRLR